LIQKELSKLTGPCPPSEILDKVETFLRQADEIKAFIIENNLRLVISIANKHLASGTGLSDLVSEGNLSLMNAVEKFDYTRGYSFSTYASWAISKDFARQIPAETSRLDRTTFSDISALQQHLRISEGDTEVKEHAERGLEHVVRENLNERERYIVQNHFALEGSGLKKKPKTLQQIGEELGLSKERVRQIELVALQKLRHSLSPEEFGKIIS
jgi:RNA polymerase sigma factor (sigma-70 family)